MMTHILTILLTLILLSFDLSVRAQETSPHDDIESNSLCVNESVLTTFVPKYPRVNETFTFHITRNGLPFTVQPLLPFTRLYKMICSTSGLKSLSDCNTSSLSSSVSFFNVSLETTVASNETLLVTSSVIAAGPCRVCYRTEAFGKPFYIRYPEVDGKAYGIITAITLPITLVCLLISVLFLRKAGYNVGTIGIWHELVLQNSTWISPKILSHIRPKVLYILVGVYIGFLFIAQPAAVIAWGAATASNVSGDAVLIGLTSMILGLLTLLIFYLGVYCSVIGWKFTRVVVVAAVIAVTLIAVLFFIISLLTYPFFFSSFTYLVLMISAMVLIMSFYYNGNPLDGIADLQDHLKAHAIPKHHQKELLEFVTQFSPLLPEDLNDDMTLLAANKMKFTAFVGVLYVTSFVLYLVFMFSRYPLDTGIPYVAVAITVSTFVLDTQFLLVTQKSKQKNGSVGLNENTSLSPLKKSLCILCYRSIMCGFGDRWWLLAQALLYFFVMTMMCVAIVRKHIPVTDVSRIASQINPTSFPTASMTTEYVKTVVIMVINLPEFAAAIITLGYIAEIVFSSTQNCTRSEPITVRDRSHPQYLFAIASFLIVLSLTFIYLTYRMHVAQRPRNHTTIAGVVAFLFILGANLYLIFATSSMILSGLVYFGFPAALLFFNFLTRFRKNHCKEIYFPGISNVSNPTLETFVTQMGVHGDEIKTMFDTNYVFPTTLSTTATTTPVLSLYTTFPRKLQAIIQITWEATKTELRSKGEITAEMIQREFESQLVLDAMKVLTGNTEDGRVGLLASTMSGRANPKLKLETIKEFVDDQAAMFVHIVGNAWKGLGCSAVGSTLSGGILVIEWSNITNPLHPFLEADPDVIFEALDGEMRLWKEDPAARQQQVREIIATVLAAETAEKQKAAEGSWMTALAKYEIALAVRAKYITLLTRFPALVKYHLVILLLTSVLMFIIMGIYIGELVQGRYLGWAIAVSCITVSLTVTGCMHYFTSLALSRWLFLYIGVPMASLIAYGLGVFFVDLKKDTSLLSARVLLFGVVSYPYALSMVYLILFWKHYGWSKVQDTFFNRNVFENFKSSDTVTKRIMLAFGVSFLCAVFAAAFSVIIAGTWVAFPAVVVCFSIFMGMVASYGHYKGNQNRVSPLIMKVWFGIAVFITAIGIIVGVLVKSWILGISVFLGFSAFLLFADSWRHESRINPFLGGSATAYGPLLIPAFRYNTTTPGQPLLAETAAHVKAFGFFGICFFWACLVAVGFAPQAIGISFGATTVMAFVLYVCEKTRTWAQVLQSGRYYMKSDHVYRAYMDAAQAFTYPDLTELRYLLDAEEQPDAGDATNNTVVIHVRPTVSDEEFPKMLCQLLNQAHPTTKDAARVSLTSFGVLATENPKSPFACDLKKSQFEQKNAFTALENQVAELTLSRIPIPEKVKDDELTRHTKMHLYGKSGLDHLWRVAMKKRWNSTALSSASAEEIIQLQQYIYQFSQLHAKFLCHFYLSIEMMIGYEREQAAKQLQEWLEYSTGKVWDEDMLADFLRTSWDNDEHREFYVSQFQAYVQEQAHVRQARAIRGLEVNWEKEYNGIVGFEEQIWADLLREMTEDETRIHDYEKRQMALLDQAQCTWEEFLSITNVIVQEVDDFWFSITTIHGENKLMWQQIWVAVNELMSTDEPSQRTDVTRVEESARAHLHFLQSQQLLRVIQKNEEERKRIAAEIAKKEEEERKRVEEEARLRAQEELRRKAETENKQKRTALEGEEGKHRGEVVTEQGKSRGDIMQSEAKSREAITLWKLNQQSVQRSQRKALEVEHETKYRAILQEVDAWWNFIHLNHDTLQDLWKQFQENLKHVLEDETSTRKEISAEEEGSRNYLKASLAKQSTDAENKRKEEEKIRQEQQRLRKLQEEHRKQRAAMEETDRTTRVTIKTEETTARDALQKSELEGREAAKKAEQRRIQAVVVVPPAPAPPPNPEADVAQGKSWDELCKIVHTRKKSGVFEDSSFKVANSQRIATKVKGAVLFGSDGGKENQTGYVCQGGLGDCWLISAIASVAEYKNAQLVKESLFPYWEKMNDGVVDGVQGCYAINMFRTGRLETIIIDDTLPWGKWAATSYAQIQSKRVWPALVEKAYAKLYKGYKPLEGGLSHCAFEDLVGAVGVYRSWEPSDAYIVSGKLWTDVCRWYHAGHLLGTSSGDGADTDTNKNNVVLGHAFSILHVVELGEQQRLLQVRNPWGRTEWNGDYSDKSAKWTQALRKKMEEKGFPVVDADDGAFWIEYKDWVQNFDGMALGYMFPKKTHTTFTSDLFPWNHGKGKPRMLYCTDVAINCIQFQVTSGPAFPILFAVTQNDCRGDIGKSDSGLAINLYLKEGPITANRRREIAVATEAYSYTRSKAIEYESLAESKSGQFYFLEGAAFNSETTQVRQFYYRIVVATEFVHRIVFINNFMK